MDLKDFVSLFNTIAAQQMTLWNILWGVGIGVLVFLWKEPRDKNLKRALILGFIFFWLSNLFAIVSIEKNLLDIAKAIQNYRETEPADVPLTLRPALKSIKPVSMALVAGFHVFVSTIFTVAMSLSKTTVVSDEVKAG